MIFILHYLIFNLGLPPVIILITLFLQTHSTASLSEIGALLMALPFVSILIKPLFCALADRHQAHKLYLIFALLLMALGYGSLSIAPFFPDFIREHGRLVWYLDIAGIVVGFSAFGVVWSLGDALAVNHAQMVGVTWGAYRAWGVVAWGLGGIFIGQINELPFLPKYVPAWFVLVAANIVECVLLAFWPNKHFVMGGTLDESHRSQAGAADATQGGQLDNSADAPQSWRDLEDNWSSANRSLTGTLRGTISTNPRMIGAVANIFMEDLGGTLKSSLRLGPRRRTGLDEILEQHQMSAADSANASGLSGATRAQQKADEKASPQANGGDTTLTSDSGPAAPNGQQQQAPDASPAPSELPANSSTATAQGAKQGGPTFGRATLRRAQLALSRMNSLSAASGRVIADEFASSPLSQAASSFQNDCSQAAAHSGHFTPAPLAGRPRQQVMYMSSLASNASLSKAAAARALGPRDSPMSLVSAAGSQDAAGAKQLELADFEANDTPAGGVPPAKLRSAEDLQLVLLKLIVRGDPTIWKNLVIFTIFGSLLTIHLSYFFVHLEQLCREKGSDFATVSGGMLAAHSVSEFLSFTVVVPQLVPRVGRSGALLACALFYAARFAYYGTYLAELSPYTGVPFELAHGIVYGIVYSLITDLACETVNQVDQYLPDLVARGHVDAAIDPRRLKLHLRATMQGLFSGAFDGLGNGLGALFGGVFLDSYPFTKLWQFCAYVCVAIIVVYPLTEWRTLCGRARPTACDGDKLDASLAAH